MLAKFTRSAQPRMVIYSQDGYGLGHMRRTNSIARQLLRTNPNACILTLSDSPLGQLFGMEKNQDYLKLPSIIKNGPGEWKPVNLPVPFDEVLTMRKNLIHSAVLCFEPHLFLVDHMPHGAMGELLFTLESLKELKTGTCIVLGLRDILDSPEVIKRRWEEEGAYHALECFYDLVMVFGMQEVYDIAEQYQLPGAVKDLLRYTGYVCTPATPRYTGRARQQVMGNNRDGVKMILVMAGGGADAYPMMSTFLDALPWVLENKSVTVMMVTGPFMPIEQRHNLEAAARGMPVKVRDKVSDILSYLDACDLVVSMAGYNSTIEILRSGKPAILLPRSGPSQEQRTRARLFAGQRWVRYLDPLDTTPEILAQAVVEDLEKDLVANRPSFEKPNLNGARTAVDQLISLLPPELRGDGNDQPTNQVIIQSNKGPTKTA